MDTLDCMRAFAAVAQEQAFTGAGRRLGISTKQVSKAVAQLETRLDVQLFVRTTRKVSLTDVGRAYLPRCIGLLDDLDDLESAVQERVGGPGRHDTGHGADGVWFQPSGPCLKTLLPRTPQGHPGSPPVGPTG